MNNEMALRVAKARQKTGGTPASTRPNVSNTTDLRQALDRKLTPKTTQRKGSNR